MYVAANVPDTLSRASRQAVKGGIAGASAQAINVSVLMGMYTVMKYQYCNGGQFLDVTRKLWADPHCSNLEILRVNFDRGHSLFRSMR